MLKINGRSYYDFNLNVDILMKSNGVAGVSFRMRDEYNYYAFIIDKSKGVKTLAKVRNGRAYILQEIKDGGILLDNWHRLNIETTAGKIKVHIYDMDQVNQKNSEKIIEAIDGSYSSGGIGIFVNNAQGFYFDNFIITPVKCWTPWQPMKDFSIITPTSSVYNEDFSGSIAEKFITVDPEENVDGPSDWKLNCFHTSTNPAGLSQNSLIYDKSSSRRSAMIIKKDKIINNGTIGVNFIPYSEEGTISIIFKYLQQKDSSGQTTEMYYIFDIISDKTTPQFELRKFINGILSVVKTANTLVKDLPILGFKTSVTNKVEISLLGEKIVIKYSVEGSPLIEILSVEERSIPHGNFGVGTFRTKAVFTSLEMFPPLVHMSEADKNTVLTAESDKLFFPKVPGMENKNEKKVNGKSVNPNENKIEEKNSSNKSGDAKGLANGSKNKKESGATFGWNTCIEHSSTKDRQLYCDRNFSIPETKANCKVRNITSIKFFYF